MLLRSVAGILWISFGGLVSKFEMLYVIESDVGGIIRLIV